MKYTPAIANQQETALHLERRTLPNHFEVVAGKHLAAPEIISTPFRDAELCCDYSAIGLESCVGVNHWRMSEILGNPKARFAELDDRTPKLSGFVESLIVVEWPLMLGNRAWPQAKRPPTLGEPKSLRDVGHYLGEIDGTPYVEVWGRDAAKFCIHAWLADRFAAAHSYAQALNRGVA